MGLSAKLVHFNLDSTKVATDTQAVTGVGFQGKVGIFWYSGNLSTGSDNVGGGNTLRGFGVAISSSSRRCIASASFDAQASAITNRTTRDDSFIATLSSSDTADGLVDFVSWDADGFTFVYDDAVPANIRVSALILGGTDLTNYALGTFTNGASTGNFNVTGVGFQPDAVCIFSTLLAANNVGVHSQFSVGWATGSSAQGLVAGRGRDNQATMDTRAYGYNGECIGQVVATSSGCTGRGSFVGFISDGFTINCLEAQASPWYYLALKGGQYTVGDLLTQTDTTTDISETLAYQPEAIMFMSAARALDTQDTPSNHDSWTFGAYDGTNQGAQAAWDENNTADSETATAIEHDNVYINISSSDAVQGLMKVISRSSTGFVCEMSDDADPSQCWVTYFAIGAIASATYDDSVSLARSAGVSEGGGLVIGDDVSLGIGFKVGG